ncbi:VapE domain-containing protein [Comamonas sp.]|uniref:VapE domain-containing protein n=1 Tax=Comamonas sp. TaxID=34028 RepID=UPI003A8DCA95
MNQHRDPLPPIQFGPLREALLADAENLVVRWLPGGQFDGPEYRCADLSGGHGHSCSVNVKTGKWADFATGDQGNDLIGLYAAIHDLSNAKAAIQVAREERLEAVAGLVMQASGAPVQPAVNPRPAPEPKASKPADKEEWSTLRPVPENAQQPTFAHHHRQAQDLEHQAEYRVDAFLHGFVMRYRTSDGGKDTLPYTFCQSARDNSRAWKWKTWDEPRPLYLPGHALPNGRTVILVEGELKADVLQQVLDAVAPGIYCVASWPGGSKAWKKSDWSWLAGSTVLLWPDSDAQREKLTRAELAEVKDDSIAKEAAQAAKPLLPAQKQPGMGAMLGIGALLQSEHACKVQLLPIPAPGEKASGWDCKDAIQDDGWTGEDVLAFFGRAQPLPAADADMQADAQADAPAAAGGGGKPPKPLGPVGTGGNGGAMPPLDEPDNQDWLWQFYDHKKNRWDLRRSLVVAALQNDPKLKGCVAFNELSKSTNVRKAWPWPHGKAGALEADSTLLLGLYLNDVYGVGDVSTQNIKDGIATLAYTERFHPVREWLAELEWDGKPRLDKWLIHVLGESPETLKKPMDEYMALVGRYWVLGMVWRVMEPGCKFDYMPVLEGKGGLRKSTLGRLLAGRPEWFSDTKFDLSRGKEAYEQVRGKWLYEIQEMSSFSKADVNDIKAFVSSMVDNYRVAYGDQAQEFPRQCVLFGSTNDKKYLRDRTGNRRFWPVPVRHKIKTEWIERWRDQLMAEAYVLYQQGGVRYTPTEAEEERLFVPMQESRQQESAVDAELFKLLTRSPSMNEGVIHCDAQRVAVNLLIKALGVDIGKATTVLKGQIEAWLEGNGWTFIGRKRVNGVLESGVYTRPDVWPPVEEESDAADWTQQTEAKPATAEGLKPEAEASRSYEAPPLPDGIGAAGGSGREPWDGDDEPF